MATTDYKFPRIELDEAQRTYLRALNDYFFSEKELVDYNSLEELWNELREFSPIDIPPGLIYGSTEISLWGIWHVNPTAEIFHNVELIVKTIRRELNASRTSKRNFRVEDMVSKIDNISEKDVRLAFIQIYRQDLADGKKGDGFDISEISVNSGKLLGTYRRFTSLVNYLQTLYGWDQYSQEPPKIRSLDLNGYAGDPAMLLQKAKIIRKSDNDLKPLFNVTTLAVDIGEILGRLNDIKGQMIGVFGKWGRGKSFLLRELRSIMQKSDHPEYHFIEYYAWKYQDSPASWAYLYELMAEVYLHGEGGTKGFWYENLCLKLTGFFRLLWLNLHRGFSLDLAKVILVGTVICLYAKFINPAGGWAVFPVAFAGVLYTSTKFFNVSAKELISKYTLRNTYKSTLGLQAEIQKELTLLLKLWIKDESIGKKKVVLVIEDLDRCSPDKIVHVIEGLRVMLEDDDISKRVVVIAAIDEQVLKRALRIKFSDIKGSESSELGLSAAISEHMDKLFILAIKLGSLEAVQRHAFLDEIFPTYQLSGNQPGSGGMPSTGQAKEKNDGTSSERADQQPADSASGKNTAQWKELNQLERNFLKEYFRDKDWVTPRRMMVLFLRYQLFKNLLIDYYETLGKANPWDDLNNHRLVMNLMLDYSNLCNPEVVLKDLATLKSVTDGKKDFSRNFSFHLEKAEISIEEKIAVLKIMEMVVAY